MDNNVFEEIKAGMEDALAYVKSDKTKVRVHYLVPGPVDVKAVREKTGLTQEEFCRSYAFSPSDRSRACSAKKTALSCSNAGGMSRHV